MLLSKFKVHVFKIRGSSIFESHVQVLDATDKNQTASDFPYLHGFSPFTLQLQDIFLTTFSCTLEPCVCQIITCRQRWDMMYQVTTNPYKYLQKKNGYSSSQSHNTASCSSPSYIYNRLGGLVEGCSPRCQKVVGSNPNRIEPKTLVLVFATSPLSKRHYGVIPKTGYRKVSFCALLPCEKQC